MKSFPESLEISKSISELFNVYELNMKELSKLLNEATDYVEEKLEGLKYQYGQAGPRSRAGWHYKLQPKTYAFSIFNNNIVNNGNDDDQKKSDWIIVLMILLREHTIEEKQECTCLSVLYFNPWQYVTKFDVKSSNNEWVYQAMVSMKRKDAFEYSISDWSEKVIKVVAKEKVVSYLLNIPVGCFENEDDFPLLLKPAINSLINKNEKEIKNLDCFYIPNNF